MLRHSAYVLLAAIAFAHFAVSATATDTALKASLRLEAEAFAERARSAAGQDRDRMIESLGLPDSRTAQLGYETWKYRRHFGTFRRNKAIFGHLTLTLEVRVECLLKDNKVLSVTVSPIEEVRKPRRE